MKAFYIFIIILLFMSSIRFKYTSEPEYKTDCQRAYNVYECEYNGKGAFVPKEVKHE
jgi:hypothetical protein